MVAIKPIKLTVFSLFLLALGVFVMIGASGTSSVHANGPGNLLPKKLAIFYGWPSLVNGSATDVNLATEVFNDMTW